MIELRDALEAQAQAVVVRADLPDVRRRARARRRRRNVTRAVCALVVLAIGAGSLAAWRHAAQDGATTLTRITPASRQAVALQFDEADAGEGTSSAVRRGLERADPGAEQGAWTVSVRRPDGSLGRHGAVVTYPVPAPVLERTVDVNGAVGGAAAGSVVWPIGGGFARVRGDLDDATLLAVARATSIEDARPVLADVSGLGLLVVRSAPYRSPSVREMRYGSGDLGEGAALGNGLTYTDVFTGGGFEDQLFAQGAPSFLDVRGRHTVVSIVGGGNATMAWELAPGVVALVGYSGASLGPAAVDALARLVQRTKALDAAAWSSLDAQVVEQDNGFGGP